MPTGGYFCSSSRNAGLDQPVPESAGAGGRLRPPYTTEPESSEYVSHVSAGPCPCPGMLKSHTPSGKVASRVAHWSAVKAAPSSP